MLWGDASADSSPPITARGNIPPAPFLEEHSQDTKAYEKEPSLVAMAELTNAYLANDIAAFEPVLRRYVCMPATTRRSKAIHATTPRHSY